MGKSRYPRRGQRIAPATLGELLNIPVPEKYLDSSAADSLNKGLRLSDLDESTWDRFSDQTCQSLAGEVIKAVGRAARMPTSVGDRQLPALPSGMKLSDLDLEVRTLNCLVAAGIHERPQDLQTLRIEGVLALRGFWVKCLVDLLVSLEYVNDHPESRRALRGKSKASVKAPRIAGRYPRQTHRLAPHSLREILTDPIPRTLVEGTPLEGCRLCDLDESVWKHLEHQQVVSLSELVVQRVNVGGYNRTIQDRKLPKPPKGMHLEDLQLENRTYNCLRREGYAKKPDDLAQCSISQLMAYKAFGAKCLVDLLTSLETLVDREGKLDAKLTEEAIALNAIPEIRRIHFSDPRLGSLLRAIDSEANTVAELAQHVLKRRLDPPDPLRLYEQVHEVRSRIDELMQMSLEDELIDIFSPVSTGRDRQIVSEYFGWDGSGGHTLEELGQKYNLSRERIRQVCVRAVKRNRRSRVFAPALDRALAFILQRLPCPARLLRTEFDAAGISKSQLPLEAVREAGEFLSREPGFEVVSLGKRQLVVKPEHVALPKVIIQIAKRTVLSYGATTISEVASEVDEQESIKPDHSLIEATLATLDDFQWLDQKRGWFQLESLPQYGLPNMVDKILSVTEQIEVSKLRGAIARYRRTGRKVPPSRVLLEFCKNLGGVRVEGNLIIADPLKDWREVLGGVEAGMVRVLKEHGPVMERGAFEEHCIRGGMNRFSFNAIIMCSPVISQYGRSVYGLLGAKIDRKKVQALAARKPGTPPKRVLRGFGKTEDGQHYLAYQLSKAAISGGVITVPSAMKDEIDGKFTIHTPENQNVGTLVSKNGCAWGLGPVLRGHDAQPGQFLLILFDLDKRDALAQIGSQDILPLDNQS